MEDKSDAIDPAVGQIWHDLLGGITPCLSQAVQRAAFAILWMSLRGEREGLPSMLATSYAEAAGVAGRQKWGLVLSSSARVSQVTYQTVVGVRYPELVTCNGATWSFGKFVTPAEPLRGGFLPIFWDVPRAETHAVSIPLVSLDDRTESLSLELCQLSLRIHQIKRNSHYPFPIRAFPFGRKDMRALGVANLSP